MPDTRPDWLRWGATVQCIDRVQNFKTAMHANMRETGLETICAEPCVACAELAGERTPV